MNKCSIGDLNLIKLNILKYIINNPLILIVSFAVIIRIVSLFFLINYNDPQYDAGDYFSLSKNIACGKGFYLDFKFLYSKNIEESQSYSGQIGHYTHIFPPLYPILGSLAIKVFGENMFSLIILNFLLHIFSIIVLFKIILLISDKRFALFAAILFSSSPMIFDYSLGLLSESSYVFFFIASIFYTYKYLTSILKRDIYINLVILSFTVVATFWIRNQAIIVLAFPLAIFFLFKRKFKDTFIFLSIIIIAFVLWEFGFSYYYYNGIVTSRYFAQYSYNFFLSETTTLPLLSTQGIINFVFKERIEHILEILNSILKYDFLFLLFPFCLIFLVKPTKNNFIQIIKLLFLAEFLLTIILGINIIRYYIALIPISIILLSFFYAQYIKLLYKPLIIIIIATFLVYFYRDARLTRSYYTSNKSERYLRELAYKSLQFGNNINRIGASSSIRSAYYLDKQVAMLPWDLSQENIDIWISRFNIQGILIDKSDLWIYTHPNYFTKVNDFLYTFINNDSIVTNKYCIYNFSHNEFLSFYRIKERAGSMKQ